MSSNDEALYLCLDQGGHSSRALLFDGRGQLLQQTRRPLTASGDGDRVEYVADTLLASLRDCLVELRAWLDRHKPSVRLVAGLATQRSNIACWDRLDGAALAPILSWQDRRHADWLEQFRDRAERLHALTGLPLSPHYGASKLRWCLDHLPAVQQAQREQRLMLGPMAAWLVARLTREGRALADPVNASRTQLWSVQRRDWDDELLGLFGIPRELLPPCVPNRTDFGHLRLGDDVPLQLVSGDQSAALFAYGPLRQDTAYLNLGTGAFVSRPTGYTPEFDPQLLTSQVMQDGEQGDYVLEGTVNGAGAALDWLARQQDRAPFEPDELTRWLAEEHATIPLFLNGVGGLAAPYWRAGFESRFAGRGTPSQQAVAVIESIVFLLQVNLERMTSRLGPVQRLQVTGGLAHLDGLCQRLADLGQSPVYRPGECEATARGTAWLLAGQPVDWPEPGPGRLFEPHKNPTLQQRYTNWQEAMEKALSRG